MADYQIFISYRRDGGDDLAGRISDKLTGLGYRVFYDIESMHAGTFNTQIFSALEQCADVLLILPPNSLDRCADENDWVRQEIEHAIKCNKNIIPVMMRGFTFPEVLPESINNIRYYEGVGASTEYFNAVIEKIEKLLRSVNETQTPRAEEPESELANGVRFLNYKMYDQARLCLESVLRQDISNPEVYFYCAVCALGGKRPFAQTKQTVDRSIEQLRVAVSIEDRAIYRYLLAYIKFDYYEKKMLRVSPDYKAELAAAAALGITEGQIASLFELLGVERPAGF